MPAKKVIQTHHLEFQRKDKVKVNELTGKPEKTGETVLLYKGEHWAITQLQRRKNISTGFLRALEFWINSVKDTAITLKK